MVLRNQNIAFNTAIIRLQSYWRLKPDANIRDLLLAVRADEASHRDVNHELSVIDTNDPNPFIQGSTKSA